MQLMSVLRAPSRARRDRLPELQRAPRRSFEEPRPRPDAVPALGVRRPGSAHGEDAMRFVRLVAGAQPDGIALPPNPGRRRSAASSATRPACSSTTISSPRTGRFTSKAVVDHAARHGLRYLCEARPADVHPGRYPESDPGRGAPVRRRPHRARTVLRLPRLPDVPLLPVLPRSRHARADRRLRRDACDLRVAAPIRPATDTSADLTDGVAATYLALGRRRRSPRRFDREGGAGDPCRALARRASKSSRCCETRAGAPAARAVPRSSRAANSPSSSPRTTQWAFVDLHTWEPPMATSPGVRPRASALARIEIERGTRVTSLRHRQVEIDDPDCRRGPRTPRRDSGRRDAARGAESELARGIRSRSAASRRHSRGWRTTASWTGDPAPPSERWSREGSERQSGARSTPPQGFPGLRRGHLRCSENGSSPLSQRERRT